MNARYPFVPGPASAIRYDVTVQTDSGVFDLEQAVSEFVLYPDSVACMGAPVGSQHLAYISGDNLKLYIPPVPTIILCEDLEP